MERTIRMVTLAGTARHRGSMQSGSTPPMKHDRCVVVAVLLLASLGCNDSGSRVPLAGTVSQAGGDPVNGSITFIPADESAGPAATAAITDGRYQFDASTGPLPGRHRVTIEVKQDGTKLEGLRKGEKPAGKGESHFTFRVVVPSEGTTNRDFRLE